MTPQTKLLFFVCFCSLCLSLVNKQARYFVDDNVPSGIWSMVAYKASANQLEHTSAEMGYFFLIQVPFNDFGGYVHAVQMRVFSATSKYVF